MISIIIPSRNEKFLQQTIDDLLAKAEGEIEILVVLQCYWPEPSLKEDPRVTIIHKEVPSLRGAINSAVAVARYPYLLKIDAHCMVDQGYDVKLLADMEDNWVVIPRRKRLDADLWEIQDVGKPDVDYEYLSFPDNPSDFGGPGLNGRIWTERILERESILIDENLSFQGSCWFMKKTHFHNLDLMDEKDYGTFWNEAQEIGFKTWLSGGKVMVNKKTWYAHLHKGKGHGRMYNLDHSQMIIGATFVKRWINEKVWDKQTLPFHTMIERFLPMPGWGDDWKEKINYKESV